jgi:hypothetical protein
MSSRVVLARFVSVFWSLSLSFVLPCHVGKIHIDGYMQ